MRSALRRMGMWLLDQTDPGVALDPKSRALITQSSRDIDEAERRLQRASQLLSRVLVDARAANLLRIEHEDEDFFFDRVDEGAAHP